MVMARLVARAVARVEARAVARDVAVTVAVARCVFLVSTYTRCTWAGGTFFPVVLLC
jgi:hypothetical protein